MNGAQLSCCITGDPLLRRTVAGVFSADTTPTRHRLLSNNSPGLIINTDVRGTRGSHWIAIFIDKPSDTVEYFDSYGAAPVVIATTSACTPATC